MGKRSVSAAVAAECDRGVDPGVSRGSLGSPESNETRFKEPLKPE